MERKRDELRARGIEPERLPPGQYMTDRFPVLHLGPVPAYPALDDWTLTVGGDAIARPAVFTWSQLRALPQEQLIADIHCVTKWSRFDVSWRGVMLHDLLDHCGADPDASATLIARGEHGFTASIPWSEIAGHDAMLAWDVDGAPLAPEHGWPLRFVLPHLYFWKSVKWLRAIELWHGERHGFWEERGYHPHGDPFTEERYWGDNAASPRPDPASATDDAGKLPSQRSSAGAGPSRPLRTLLHRAINTATGSLADDITALREACTVVLRRALGAPDAAWPELVDRAAERGRWDRWRHGGLRSAQDPDHDSTPEVTRDLLAALAEELSVVGDVVPGVWEGEARQASTHSPEWVEGKRRRDLVFSLERVIELVQAADAAGLVQLADSIGGLDDDGQFAAARTALVRAADDFASAGCMRAETRDSLALALELTPFSASIRQIFAAGDKGEPR